MASKVKTRYQCHECGGISPKWSGQCPDCHAWNALTEVAIDERPATASRFQSHVATPAVIRKLDEVRAEQQRRLSSGFSEFDRALGGGIVGGSVVLIGGDPGIGKSTLLIQILASLSSKETVSTLYVTGEESIGQIGLRAGRLALDRKALFVLAENQLERIFSATGKHAPQVLVIDSIQTVFSASLQSAPGAVAQVRESTAQLVRFAKHTGTTVFLVGHVTKEGALAGPRVLEHMVDTVLYFEGDSNSRYRMIRSVKNRYGAVNELGVFAMTDKGLREITHPSAIFLAGHEQQVPGTVILVSRQGSRPLLLEVQALVDNTHMAQPRRITVGLEQNRLSMLLAVLHRHGGIATYDQDIYLNIVGGVKLAETAADLAILMAILSSLQNRPLSNELVVFGEVGLSGEIRPVADGQERLKEAKKHGFKKAIIPIANNPKQKMTGMEVFAVKNLAAAIQALEPMD